uniref:Uncharacterized protein n=1 Tax=Anguilla anguilla TaxID=7936 RepID=A0A0E9SK05_ANGAN
MFYFADFRMLIYFLYVLCIKSFDQL